MFKPLKNNSGMTIISVVVAFGILVTACILFTKGMQLATNMIIMADDEKVGIEESIEDYYKEKTSEHTTEMINFSTDSDPAFSFDLPVSKNEGSSEEYHYGFKYFYSKELETVPPPPEGP